MVMIDFARLIEKLKLIDALYSGATTPGERSAAENARQRIKHKIEQYQEADPPDRVPFHVAKYVVQKVVCRLLETLRY